jgi:hypothetical protein
MKTREWLLVAVPNPPPTPKQFLIKTSQINPAGWKIKKEKESIRGKEKLPLFVLFPISVCFGRV